MPDINPTVFTIGHSTHPVEYFVDLLRRHGVTALADVRSAPYSRFNPQFNREALEQALDANDIKYVFLGRELGARPADPVLYKDGEVQYDRELLMDILKRGADVTVLGPMSLVTRLKDEIGRMKGKY